MIQRILPSRASFAPTVVYALNPEKGYLLDAHLLGASEGDPHAAAEELEAYRDLFRPAVEKPVFHAALRLPPGEQLSDAEWREAAHTYMSALGYADAPYLVIRHTDQPSGDHIHLIASRVNTRGELVSDFNERRRGLVAVAELEERYGLRAVASRSSGERSVSAGELQSSHRRQVPSYRADLQERLNAALADRPTLSALLDRLEEAKIHLSISTDANGAVRGVTYEIDGHHFSASSLGRRFTWRALRDQHGVRVDAPEDRLRLEAHAARRPVASKDWSAAALARLDRDLGRLALNRTGTAGRSAGRGEASRARAALREDPAAALRGVASVAHLVRSVRSPSSLAAAAARAARHPGLADAIQLLSAVRSPQALTVTLARRTLRAAYLAGLEAAGLAATKASRAAVRRFVQLLRDKPAATAALAEQRVVASVLRAYAEAATSDRPSPLVLRERLTAAGIEIEQDSQGRPVLRLAGRELPARHLGRSIERASREVLLTSTNEIPAAVGIAPRISRVDVSALAAEDRSAALVHAHLEALGGHPVSLRVVHPNGRSEVRSDWSAAKVEKALPWLRAVNSQGAAVFVRSGDPNLVLLADVSSKALRRAELRGWTPAALVTRADGRHDAWIRLPNLTANHGPAARRTLEQLARADFGLPLEPRPGDLREGRLAGFTVEDPTSRMRLYPQLSVGPATPTDAASRLGERLRVEIEQRHEALQQLCLASRLPTPDAMRALERFTGQPGLSDAAWARLALRRGMTPADVHEALVLRGARCVDGGEIAQRYALRQVASALETTRKIASAEAMRLAVQAASFAAGGARAAYQGLRWVHEAMVVHGRDRTAD